MNCQTARAALEWVARPNELPPEFDASSVSEHLKSCEDCGVLARQRQHFDATVGHAMREVAIPSGLREQLLMNLTSQTSTSIPESAGEPAVMPRESRSAAGWRMTRRVALTACSLMVVAALLWLYVARSLPQLPLDALHSRFAALIGTSAEHKTLFTAFEGGQPARLPRNHLRVGELSDPREYSVLAPEAAWPRKQSRLAAVYFFKITSRPRTIPGILVVLPSEALEPASVPREASFLESGAKQVADAHVSAWTEGPLTYLCYVRGTERDLALLRQRSRSL